MENISIIPSIEGQMGLSGHSKEQNLLSLLGIKGLQVIQFVS
jgi:hypothetical protein